MERWRPVPLEIDVDLAHGGRWTSLRSAGREWLWTNPDPVVGAARPTVRPGATFVDAGGVEECFPTVRGTPDHGDAWSRAWTGSPADAEVAVAAGVRLRRGLAVDDGVVQASYTVTGPPGTAYVHAVHALLDLGPSARLVVPEATTVVELDDGAGAGPARPWPSGLDALGPDDGTATCVLLPGCHAATVVDGAHALDLAWTSSARAEDCSLLLWRNLGGWPADGPYRSVGIEPMTGRTADPAEADGFGACRLDASGQARWQLRVSARARPRSRHRAPAPGTPRRPGSWSG